MVDLKAKPFNLNEEQIAWVNDTLNSMSDKDKVEQLICPLAFTNDTNCSNIFFRPITVSI